MSEKLVNFIFSHFFHIFSVWSYANISNLNFVVQSTAWCRPQVYLFPFHQLNKCLTEKLFKGMYQWYQFFRMFSSVKEMLISPNLFCSILSICKVIAKFQNFTLVNTLKFTVFFFKKKRRLKLCKTNFEKQRTLC